jgi:hypothetical protein
MQEWSLILFGWLVAAIFLIPAVVIILFIKNKGIISYLVSGALTSLGASIIIFYTAGMLVATHFINQTEQFEDRIGHFSLWLTAAAALCLLGTIFGTFLALYLYRKNRFSSTDTSV